MTTFEPTVRTWVPLAAAATILLSSASVAPAQFIPTKPQDIIPKKPEDVFPGLPKPHNPFAPRPDVTVISDPTPAAPAPEQKVWIQNRTNNTVYYQLSSSVTAAENVTLPPGAGRWHIVRANVPRFTVTFDNSFAAGFQGRRYGLIPGSLNDFRVLGNGLELYRR
jgi:hypothetical protein